MRITDPRDILLAPVISEKSYGLLDENKYTFVVAPGRQQDRRSRSPSRRSSTSRSTGVNTLNRQGKRKRTRSGCGKRKDTKRAIVSVADGQRIDIFGGPVS